MTKQSWYFFNRKVEKISHISSLNIIKTFYKNIFLSPNQGKLIVCFPACHLPTQTTQLKTLCAVFLICGLSCASSDFPVVKIFYDRHYRKKVFPPCGQPCVS